MSAVRAVIHCSASVFGTAVMIDKWHRERGWREIGYHAVIENGFPTKDHFRKGVRWKLHDGSVTGGRGLGPDGTVDLNERGAHAYGFNKDTVAVCAIGDAKFTKKQIISLVSWCALMRSQFKIVVEDFIGHYEIDDAKTCPNMDMELIRGLLQNKWRGFEILDSLTFLDKE